MTVEITVNGDVITLDFSNVPANKRDVAKIVTNWPAEVPNPSYDPEDPDSQEMISNPQSVFLHRILQGLEATSDLIEAYEENAMVEAYRPTAKAAAQAKRFVLSIQ